jgi:hypothetical protein
MEQRESARRSSDRQVVEQTQTADRAWAPGEGGGGGAASLRSGALRSNTPASTCSSASKWRASSNGICRALSSFLVPAGGWRLAAAGGWRLAGGPACLPCGLRTAELAARHPVAGVASGHGHFFECAPGPI